MLQSDLPTGCEIQCRGCSHRGWDPIQSESQKENWIRTQLSSWNEVVQPIRGVRGLERWGYRKKTCLHAEWKGKSWAFGLLAPLKGKLHEYEVIDIPRCPIHSDFIQNLVQSLSSLLPGPERLPLVYLAISGTIATFVLKSNAIPEIPELDWAQWGLTGIYANLNPSAGKRVFSNRGWIRIWGKPHGVDTGHLYGPECFQQQIPSLHEESLHEATDFLMPNKESGVLDLCSGLGKSLSLWKMNKARFIGVELSADAVHCAEMNVGKGSLLRGRVSERLPQLTQWLESEKFNEILLYANPPRLGLEAEVLEWIVSVARPIRMAYLSCSVGTLKRDLFVLEKSGYCAQRIIPYDFFPQTHHVETLVLLSR